MRHDVARQSRLFGGEAPWEAMVAALEDLPSPAGSEIMDEFVREVGLAPGEVVLDIGAYGGRHAIHLASAFGCRAIALDLVLPGLIEAAAAISSEGVGDLVLRVQGDAHTLPLQDHVVDLVWARDMLSCVDPDLVLGECARVLKPGGNVALHAVYMTDLMEQGEGERLAAALALTGGSDRSIVEGAIVRQGFTIRRQVELGAGWPERAAASGDPRISEDLLAVMRLQRGSEALIRRFGEEWFETILAWHQWAPFMALGKLEEVAYLLERSDPPADG